MPDLTVAQNLFIGREPWGFFTSERRLNAQRAGADRAPAPAAAAEGPRRRPHGGQAADGGDRQGAVLRARLLIMDEPTAALNDAEVEVLHELIRRFVGPDTGVIYISHRMDELQRIAERITVIRDGRYIGTRETADTTHEEVIAMMVGRELTLGRAAGRRRADREAVLEVEDLSTKELLKDVSFELRTGEILGFAGLMGAGRTEVARAIVGADRIEPARSGCAAARCGSTTRPTPRGTASATCPRTASSSACCSSRRSTPTSGSARWPSASSAGASSRTRRCARPRASTSRRCASRRRPSRQTAKNLCGGNQQKVVHRQVAGQGLRHPDLRRADPRHRRRRQGGDLPAPQRARRRPASRSS